MDKIHVTEYIENLKKEIEMLREALEFYADSDNWCWGLGQGDLIVIKGDKDETSKNNFIGGKRARQALKKLGDKK